ncbi:hypothetical protein OG568_54855 (plasmid) [Streptomyces sp. NBC_01450]|uniref:hypothetical protein n=1 Tax=Streptomyces sp. NBC_01450 TaxID=2903871 RepID=UPI002E3652D9|nr:hypothetical protein [Streptomyces sp. NBC_01450]
MSELTTGGDDGTRGSHADGSAGLARRPCLVRRKADTDYNTLEGLARHLTGLFWAVVEELNPVQKDLRLSQELYDQWRVEIQYWRKKGQTDRTRERRDVTSVLLSVRGLYVDLHSWAIAEPER